MDGTAATGVRSHPPSRRSRSPAVPQSPSLHCPPVVLAALLATPAVAAPGAGPGAAQCRDYAALYDNQLPAQDFLAWAQGYIAAANRAYGQHVRVDGATLENWLVAYCHREASHDYATAVLAFVRAHVD